MKAAQSGATALVPPTTPSCPSTITAYPVSGSATPATSGTPRPVVFTVPAGLGTCTVDCYAGFEKCALTPPPVAPPRVPSFQTVSDLRVPSLAINLVPPQESIQGLEAGKSTWLCPSVSPSDEPLSPDAAHTLIPSKAAS